MSETTTQTPEDLPGRDTPDTLFVQDLNCSPRYPQRQHEIPMAGGHIELIDFKHGQKVKLPFGVAMRFTRDPSFRITDKEGNIFDPAPKLVDTSLPLQIAVNECVAEFRDLTQEALLRRAVVEIGGEKMTGRTPKKDIIAFLIALNEAKSAEKAPEGDEEEVSTAEADAMLNGRAA